MGTDEVHQALSSMNLKTNEEDNFLQVNTSELLSKIVSEYDQEIPQSQTAENPMAPRGRAPQPPRDTRKTN